MSPDHKVALAAGRAEGRTVRLYLEALEANKPRRGRRPSQDTLQRRLENVDAQLADADPLKRLHLIQERKQIADRLSVQESDGGLELLQAEFVKVAKGYGERKGITYGTWREAGVPADVLARAGVDRRVAS